MNPGPTRPSYLTLSSFLPSFSFCLLLSKMGVGYPVFMGRKWEFSHIYTNAEHYAGMWRVIINTAAAAAKSLQSCPTLCDLIDSSPPGSPVAGILQARTLEWVAISFSNAWKWKVKGKSLSRVWLLATPWTVAYQAPPSMGFSRQEYWSGVPSPSLIINTSCYYYLKCQA